MRNMVFFESEEIDLLVAGAVAAFPEMHLPGKRFANLQTIGYWQITAFEGALATGPTTKVGNNSSNDNLAAPVANYPGDDETTVGAIYIAAANVTTGGYPAIASADLSVVPKVVVTAAAVGPTVFRAKYILGGAIID
jgi:hypothetical protein